MSSGMNSGGMPPSLSAFASSPVKTSHPGTSRARPGIDAADARVRVRRHDHRAVQHVRKLDVVDVARPAREEALVLDAAHRLTDSKAGHLLGFQREHVHPILSRL